jgi:hypothetical protein
MIAIGNKFYGVFAGNGAALGRSVATSDPILFIEDVSSPAPPSLRKRRVRKFQKD